MFLKDLGGRVLCTTVNCKTNRIAKLSDIIMPWVGEEIKLESDVDKTRPMILVLEIVGK